MVGRIDTRWIIIALATLLFTAPDARGEDEVEFLSGAKLRGRVTKIDKTGRKVTFEAVVGGRKVTRVYPYGKIHAVKYRGKRYELTARTPKGGGTPRAGRGTRTTRVSKSELQRRIEAAGSSPPDWLEKTSLNYPRTLDLKWPQPAPKGWNNRKNVGQFIWDTINPNQNRWYEGVKFMHFMLGQHTGDAARMNRVQRSLGAMYFRFFQDYERTTHWLLTAGVRKGDRDAVMLAECYWRLGDKASAIALIDGRTIGIGMIKLRGDMGETSKAVQMAEAYVRAGGSKYHAYLAAADACRVAQRYQQALAYYQKVARLPANVKNGNEKRAVRRAKDSMNALRLFELSDVSKVADGVYQEQSVGYEGPVRVEVEVKAGRIEKVRVVKHKEKQYYSALRDAPAQIIKKQGVRGVDATSRATITAEAIINATAKALAKGAK